MSESGSSRRVSLTKVQRDTAAGLELISICQSATEDGRLSPEEIRDLQGWVEAYADSGLPAQAHLDATIRRVLADGVVTPEEQREVYAAVEKVLPPDLRAEVVARRRVHDAADRSRNRPIDSWDFMVAGCRYEGRHATISERCASDDQVLLARDPENRYSKHAVEVRIASGHVIGYVPDTDARNMAKLMDTGHRYDARIKKVLTGGRGPIPVVVADFYGQEASVDGLMHPDKPPARVVARRGCGLGAGAGLVVSVTVLGLLMRT